MKHPELTALAAGTGDVKLLAECIALAALDQVRILQHKPATVPERVAQFFAALAAQPAGDLQPTVEA